MKKWLKLLLVALVFTISLCLFAACDGNAPQEDNNVTDITQPEKPAEPDKETPETPVVPDNPDEPSKEEPCKHDYKETVIPAGCTEKGERKFTCNICGDSYSEEIEPTGHLHFSEWEVETKATLETGGMLKRGCIDCEKYSETKEYTVENTKSQGIDGIELKCNSNVYEFSAWYNPDSVTMCVKSAEAFTTESVYLYFTPFGASELSDGRAFCLNFNSKRMNIFRFKDLAFNSEISNSDIGYTANGYKIEITFPYIKMGINGNDGLGNFAFFPSVQAAGESVSYTAYNPFVVKKYAETWLQVNENNKIYYDTAYQNRKIENWQRPGFANHDSMFVGVIKETTVEEAIIATAIAEKKGAMGFDLHLNYLNNASLMTEENLGRIFRSTSKPFLSLFYDGSKTQQERLNGLKLAIAAGSAAVDLQGFMFHAGSTLTTQTQQNRQYWENLGYNMSFVDASPAETVIEPTEIQNKKEYVKSIHDMDGEVLLSAHVSTVFNAQQALAFAEFHAMLGVDVVKIVGLGNNKLDVIECVNACNQFKESEKLNSVKVSFHLSGDPSVYISRILCPVFYGSYIAFCYPELTEYQDVNQLNLDMAVKCIEAGKETTGAITINEAIALLENCYAEEAIHSQLSSLITAYKNSLSIVGYGYGANSDMGDRWQLSNNEYHMALRSATGSKNSFNMRAFAYDKAIYEDELWFSATITASMSPFSSATRVPKVGVFIGNQQSMLAFVYNTAAKTIDLCYLKEYDFGYDSSHSSDSLVSTGLITKASYSANVSGGDAIKMTIHKSESGIEIYFAVGNEELTLIATINSYSLKEFFEYADSPCYAGALCELYMGSASVGKENWVKFSDVSYESIVTE